jgi:hypothetical protein
MCAIDDGVPILSDGRQVGAISPASNGARTSAKAGGIITAKTPNFTAVWSRIESHAGEEFTMMRGAPFTYAVKHGAVRPSRANRQIPKSDFEKALALVPLKNTAVVQDLQGPSYIYAILMDERVRAGEW